MERVGFTVGKNELIPASDEGRAVMAKLKVGEHVGVEIFRERDAKLGNRAHLLFARIGQSMGLRARNIRGWIAAATGRADMVQINGMRVLVPWSVGEMDANEFEAFWDDAIPVIYKEILPRLNEADRNEISDMLETPRAR